MTTAEKILRFEMGGVSSSSSIMDIASKDVITIPPTSTIKSAVELMVENRFRRLPVTDPGSNHLIGILGSSDIVDLIGGGKKYSLISEAHKGNFLSAINDSVRRIMNTEVLKLDQGASSRDGLKLLLSSKRGGLVVVDKKNRAKGIVTDRDFIQYSLEKSSEKRIADYMTRNVISTTPGTTVGDASKIMLRNSFRRLPIVSEESLVGIVTTRSIIKFVGENGVFDRLVNNNMSEVLRTRVSEIMSHEVAVVQKDALLKTAVVLMISTNQGTVCVLEDERLVGIFTERDALKTIAS